MSGRDGSVPTGRQARVLQQRHLRKLPPAILGCIVVLPAPPWAMLGVLPLMIGVYGVVRFLPARRYR